MIDMGGSECIIVFLMVRRPPKSTHTEALLPSTTLFPSRGTAAGNYVRSSPPARPSDWLHGWRSGRPRNASCGYGQHLADVARWRFSRAARPIYCMVRSAEHTSELQSLMRISYAVFCLKKNRDHTSASTCP